jgi:hypothetical protein
VPNPDVGALRLALERTLVDQGLRAGAKKIADEMAALPSLEDAVDAMVAMAGAGTD